MPKINAIFSLSGDTLEPQRVTDSTGIQPTLSWRKGERITSNREAFRKNGGWQISTGDQESLDVGVQLKIICDNIRSKIPELKHMIESGNLYVKFAVVIKVVGDSTPAVVLEKDVLDVANQLGAIFDIDLYVE